MKRGWLTFVTVVCLYGTYLLYAALVTPLMEPGLRVNLPVAQAAAIEIKPLSISGRIARTHLPNEDWAAEAKYQWQRGAESFIFFNEQSRIEDPKRNKLRIKPFALVWVDERREDGAAYTMVCTSAVVEFESTLQVGVSNPGRIVGGTLHGDVVITGPDGLHVEGQNFGFSEESLRLFSSHPVEFWYGPQPGRLEQVHGQAGQVDIRLKETSEPVLGGDMPHVGGLSQIALRRDVVINLVMDDDGSPSPVVITCDQQFIYNVDATVATFDGNVEVQRETSTTDGDPQFDRLHCERLGITFEPTKEAQSRRLANAADGPADSQHILQVSSSRSEAEELGIDLDLEFRSLRAVGENVSVKSDENNLLAHMDDLVYDAATGLLEMRRNNGRVEAHYGDDVLESPFVRFLHNDDNQIESVDCRGEGRVVRRDPESGEIDVDASWSESLVLRPDDDPTLNILEISGDGHVLQPLQRTGIIADMLKVWIDREALEADRHPLNNVDTKRRRTTFPIRRAEATTDVALVSPTLHLETQSLVADFTATPAGLQDETLTTKPESGLRPSSNPDGDNGSDQPVLVAADSVVAALTYDSVSRKTDVQTLTASDKVVISRAAAAPGESEQNVEGDPFSIEADAVELRNDQGNHILKLLGTPARIRHPEAEIEGKTLYFDRTGNRAMVEGTGALSILVDTNLEGRKLDHPDTLTVRWVDEMTFDGARAEFLGLVDTTLADSKMRCGRMIVSLNRRVSFAEERPDAEGLEIDRIDCKDEVVGQYLEWEGTRLLGVRNVKVAEFTVERISGDFSAQGPGHIEDWQLGEQPHVQLDPTAAANANQAQITSSELPWQFTRLDFEGTMTGNQLSRHLTIHDRVRVMHGPVARAFDTIKRDEFSQQTERAKNSIFLGSDVVQARLSSDEGTDGPGTASLLAKGHAELEGQVFRARADSISFDESKEMFTLRGRGSEAHLWRQERPGRPPEEVASKTIQFVPSKRELILDGARRINGSQ